MNLNNKVRTLWFGDLVTPSGFGRIGNEVCKRLAMRGWPLMGLSIPWNGYPLNPLNIPVIPTGGVDIWNRLTQVVVTEQPDIVVVCQDFPYAQTAFHGCRIDWSRHKLIIVTPIDGVPVHPEWARMVDLADATLVISQFGVEGMRQAGRAVGHLPPGVDTNEFYPAEDGEVAALREKLGTDAQFVMGMFAMNQGRKAVSATIAAFYEFAKDKPDAALYLDMDKVSPAGWDIPALLRQIDPPADVLREGESVYYREDAQKAEIAGLRERYLLCDVNSVVSHREGFGLPLIEAQACRIVAMAMDWCSGPEICGADSSRGMLVRRIPYMEHGTWGGARDAFPDMDDWVEKLNKLYHRPDYRAAIAAEGYRSATKRTWDAAADAFEDVLKQVADQQQKERANEPEQWYIPAPAFADDGAGTPNPVGDRPGVQPHAEGIPVPAQPGGDGRPDADGDHHLGRLQPGVQPAGAAGSAPGEGAPQRDEPRIRGERQRGGQRGEGGLLAHLEPGHEGAGA